MGKVRPLGMLDCVWQPEHGYTLTASGKFNYTFVQDELQKLAEKKGGSVPLTITIEQPRRLRSGQQNRLMWDLIAVLAEHISGHPPSGEERMDLYCQLLADYGCNVDYIITLPKVRDRLVTAYRIVRIIERHPNGMVTFMAVEGSSHFTKAEMHDFIERIFDRMAAEGVSDPRMPSWRQDWLRLCEDEKHGKT